MPRKSIDVGNVDPTMPADKVQRKTERSHEENQERAYIAASRRSDRSIEARVQSARMASEIHKKRTGKGFRITEDIVVKEEMYEEEEDTFPRSYHLLGPHMQTASPEMNSKVEAFLSNRVAMSALLAKTNDEWRENEINRLFAQSFPNAGQQAQRMSQSMPSQAAQAAQASQINEANQANQAYQAQAQVQSPTFQQVSYQQSMSPSEAGRAQSRAGSSMSSPPAPVSGSHTPNFGYAMGASSPMDFNQSPSAFTSELPPEARMFMGGMNMNDPYGQQDYGQNMYGQEWTEPQSPQYYSQPYGSPGIVKGHEQSPQHDYNGSAMDWDPMANPPSSDDSWKAFLNDTPWDNDVQYE